MYEQKKKSSVPQAAVTATRTPKLTPVEQAAQKAQAEQLALQRQQQSWMAKFRPDAVSQRQALTPVLRAGELRSMHREAVQRQRASLQGELTAAQTALPPPEILQRLQSVQETLPAAPVQRTRDGRLYIPTMQAATQHFNEQVSLQRKRTASGTLPLATWQQAARTTTSALLSLYQTGHGSVVQRQQELASSLAGIENEHDRSRLSKVVLSQVKPVGDAPAIQRMLDGQLAEQSQRQSVLANLATVQRLQSQLSDLEQEASLQSGPELTKRIEARRGQGSTLPVAIQRQLEQGLNADLSSVRVHTDAEADKLSRSVGAVAFTTGTDIFFQANKYDPHSPEGFRLLAHETTHVKQQLQGRATPGIDSDAGLEAEAKRAETKLSQLKPASKKAPKHFAIRPATQQIKVTGALQRQVDTAAINKAITLPPGQQPEQGWWQKVGQAAWKAVYETPIYQAGVLAGVVEGFFTDIWENLKALGAGAKQAYQIIHDIFTGQITGRIEGITGWLKNLSWDGIKQIADGLGGELKAQIMGQAKAWTQDDPFKRGRAQGKIIGMILAEVGIAYITAGTVTAVKSSLVASGKLTQVVSRIPGAVNLINGVNKKREAFKVVVATTKTATTKAVKSLIPEMWRKRLGTKGVMEAENALASADAQTALKQGGQKAKELPEAVASAIAIISTNDVLNSSTQTVLTQLAALKSRFGWIKSFKTEPSGKDKFDFYLIASSITIYKSYTPGNKGNWNKELNQKFYEPNKTIDISGYLYTTDSKGRVSKVEAELKLQASDRNGYQQSKVGGMGRRDPSTNKKMDEGGHLIASIFNGAGERLNMVPMDANFNKGRWKQLENLWSRELQAGRKVEVEVVVKYGNTKNNLRPSSFEITYIIDGHVTSVTLKNKPGGI